MPILVLSAQVATTSKEYNNLIDNEIKQRADAASMLDVFGNQVLSFQQILLQSSDPEDFAAWKKVGPCPQAWPSS